MESKSKLLIIVALMLFGLTVATTINVALNFKSYSIKSAIDKANATASIVKDALTAHMLNGTMDKRGYFLNQITKAENINKIWIARSEHVIKQYGAGFPSESIRDSIDKEVLSTGKSIEKIAESLEYGILRITIPYKASTEDSSINCMQCHDVQAGDTLGIISMEFDIRDVRYDGIFTIAKIFGINILFLILALLLINHFVTPYTKMFSDMQTGIKKAYRGDFTHKFYTSMAGDAQAIVQQLNTLFSKIQDTFGDIRYSLSTFIPGGDGDCSSDPLLEANIIINELSDIYKFKKTIELDDSKDMVYTRFIDILKLKYNIQHMAFYEVYSTKQTRELIYISQGQSICLSQTDKDASRCRAYRTSNDVISTEFHDLCRSCESGELDYVCLPFTINSDVSIVLSITAKTDKEMNHIKSSIVSIENYLEAAKPVLESKILMEKLRDTSLRDGMTGLYNRRFLENVIDKIMSQAERSKDNYHVLMLDIDFFKMVNDSYGHDIGDKVIVALSKVLKGSIRESDLAIRYGGEEFLIMLHNATDEAALKIAQKINSDFAALTFNVGSNESMQKTLSIGIAKFPVDGDTIWKCIKYADTALYVAKDTGRNKIVKFKPEMFTSEEF